jgi:hypothetical protein
MAERRAQDAQAARAQMHRYVRSVAQTGGAVDEIDEANALGKGAITQAEFGAIKAKRSPLRANRDRLARTKDPAYRRHAPHRRRDP